MLKTLDVVLNALANVSVQCRSDATGYRRSDRHFQTTISSRRWVKLEESVPGDAATTYARLGTEREHFHVLFRRNRRLHGYRK
ncbi:hypothetical protein LSAT2_001503 [Lamellibrachia satsuma]|nr:hypothetical protein LSAT2_001503 [Lamellibrachia satsuma]